MSPLDIPVSVCLDLGHGGRDPGAIGPNGTFEKDIVLLLGHMVKVCIEKYHYEVIMTRYNDIFVGLSNRAAFANRHDAVLFVSIHTNAFTSPIANGVETLHYPSSVLGKKAAGYIQNELVEGTGLRNRGLKPRFDLTVLSKTTMPAVVAEVGFISNPEEERMLKDVTFLQKAAGLIARGVVSYLKEEGYGILR